MPNIINSAGSLCYGWARSTAVTESDHAPTVCGSNFTLQPQLSRQSLTIPCPPSTIPHTVLRHGLYPYWMEQYTRRYTLPLQCARSLHDTTGTADGLNALLEFLPSLALQKDVFRAFGLPLKCSVTLLPFLSAVTLLTNPPFFVFTDRRNSAQTHHFTRNLQGMCQMLASVTYN